MTIGSALRAQEVNGIAASEYLPDISLDMRGGYDHDFANGTGRFCGDGLYLNIDGKISRHFSYSFNQTLASRFGDVSGFDGTNWLALTCEIGNFSITAGKDCIFVGSFEYDALDIDSFYDMNSMFYNMFDCWQWGVSAAWYPAETQSVTVQFANSPLSWGESDRFAYAAAWRGEWDCYESYWSVNLWQYGKGQFVKALNLGNRFYFGDFSFDLEYMTRATDMKKFFDSDFTVLLAPAYEWSWGRAFAKVGWEKAGEDNFGYDYTGENLFYGAGVEFFPLKENRDIRLHAQWSSNDYYTGGHLLNIGLTWKFDITGAVKHLATRSAK